VSDKLLLYTERWGGEGRVGANNFLYCLGFDGKMFMESATRSVSDGLKVLDQ
jgi:hypothetical protein